MKQVKQTKRFKAAKGHILPIFYNGSIIRISDDSEVEIDLDKLLYEPKIQLDKAIADKSIIELGDK